MIALGELAPSFSLPGVVGPRTEIFELNRQIINGPLVLVFCLEPEVGNAHQHLREICWLELEPEVSVMGIIPRSVTAARRIQRTYELSIPILSDQAGRTFECYGFARRHSDRRQRYAVMVIDRNRRIRNCLLTHSLADVDISTLHQAVKRQLNNDQIKTYQ